ncbi:hypothetical protein Gpo141_00007254 [Globisporangium polare]
MTAAEPQQPENPAPTIVVRQFRDEDRAAVGAIFVDGFPPLPPGVEAPPPQMLEYVQRSLETDLKDVFGTYINTGGNFWVATTVGDEPEVVGMVALEKKQDGDGELRRMSVKKEFRRFGVGKLLVVELESWAKANEFKTVSLSTGEPIKVAQKFYTAMGYEKVRERPVPEAPGAKFMLFDYLKHL